MAHFKHEGTFIQRTWVLGEALSRVVTIASGAGALVAGTVLGKITASGKFITSLAAASDGSQVVDVILGEDVDATAADKKAVVYIRGRFDQAALILGAGHTLGSIDATLRDKSIWLESPMG